MDLIADIVPFKARRYEAILITKIKVINSRNRDQEQFEMNVGSIKQNGMLRSCFTNGSKATIGRLSVVATTLHLH